MPSDPSLPGDFESDRTEKTFPIQAHSGSGWVPGARLSPGQLRLWEAEPPGKPALPVAGVPRLPDLILGPSAPTAVH